MTCRAVGCGLTCVLRAEHNGPYSVRYVVEGHRVAVVVELRADFDGHEADGDVRCGDGKQRAAQDK